MYPPPARPPAAPAARLAATGSAPGKMIGITGAALAELRASSRTRARGGQGRGRPGAGPGECPPQRPPAGGTPAARRTELLSARTAPAGRPVMEPPAARGGGPTFVPYRKLTARVRVTSPPRSGPVPPARPARPPRPGTVVPLRALRGPRPRRRAAWASHRRPVADRHRGCTSTDISPLAKNRTPVTRTAVTSSRRRNRVETRMGPPCLLLLLGCCTGKQSPMRSASPFSLVAYPALTTHTK
jgi:hypothetical protein